MKRLVSSKILIFPLAVFAFFIVFSFGKKLGTRQDLQGELDNLNAEISGTEKKRQSLDKEKSELANSAFLEKEAREKFNLKKPEEDIYMLLDRKVQEEQSISKEQQPKKEKNKSKLQSWWEYVFKNDE